MPRKKKKGQKFNNQNFTINDSANAPKPVSRVKKSTSVKPEPEESWEDIATDEFNIVEELNEDGTKNMAFKKNTSKTEINENETNAFYPEIVWYLISLYIKPEDVCRFALINEITHAITKKESFWRNLYNKYCNQNLIATLPPRLRLENSYTTYGLRQRVIRALYAKYDVFVMKLREQASQDSTPHQLIKRRCINVWHEKTNYWSLFFKLKKTSLNNGIKNERVSGDFLKELCRVDANPEEDCKVMKVTCRSGGFHNDIADIIGMSLSVVTVVLGQGFAEQKLRLGFNSGSHNISRSILPEVSIVIDKVLKITVLDWWHVDYPFENRPPSYLRDDESLPMLKEDFFNMKVGEL